MLRRGPGTGPCIVPAVCLSSGDLSLESAPSELASNGSIKSLVHDLLAGRFLARALVQGFMPS